MRPLYIAFEGVEQDRGGVEKVVLEGFSFSKSRLVLPSNGSVLLQNRGRIKREIEIRKGNDVRDVISIAPGKDEKFMFRTAGVYRLVDKYAPWSSVDLKVVDDMAVFPVRNRTNRISLPNIAPGTYRLIIFNGVDEIYSEDLSVVSSSTVKLVRTVAADGVLRDNSRSVTFSGKGPAAVEEEKAQADKKQD